MRSILLLLIFVCPAWAADTNPSADEILANHVRAIGGYEAVKRVRTFIARGKYSEGGVELTDSVLAKMRPYFKLVGDPENPSAEFREGYDGSAWEFYGDPGVVLRTVGPAAAAIRHHSDIDGPFVDAMEKGFKVVLQGTETIAGRKAYRLRVTMLDGFEEDELVDAESWMWIASRKAAPIHAFGAAVNTETRFSDFRRVNGVLYPFLSTELDLASGRPLSEMKLNAIEINKPLDTAAFSPPTFKRTPVQQLIEALFYERADLTALQWTCRDFRRANSGISTDEPLQIAGYQILKMGEHANAIALLEMNARDYPKSSGAAFGLGRAYERAGRKDRAKAEFERAIALDSGNERAKRALRALEK